MVIAVEPGEVFDYIVKADRDKEESEQTIFRLKVLDNKTQIKIQDSGSVMNVHTGDMRIKAGNKTDLILKAGLTGVDNLKNRKGEIIDFMTDKNNIVSDDFLGMLPPKVKSELANEITEMQSLQEDELKN